MDRQNIKDICSALEQAAASLLLPIKAAGKEEALAALCGRLEGAAAQPVTLLVCGEFKRGKSTFINALIGRSVCATDTDICTSVASVIKYGPQERVVRHYGDFADMHSEEIALDELEDYTVGTAEEIGNTIYVEIEQPLDMLREGLTVIDTPGVGGLDPRHAALTNHFLPRADVTVMMTDVNEPLSSTELEFFRDRALRFSPSSLVVVNKSDLKDAASVEDIRLDTVEKIAAYAGRSSEDIACLAVSSAAEAYPGAGLGDSGFGPLRAKLEELVTERRLENVKAIKEDMAELIDLTLAPLQAQLTQIDCPDTDQVRELSERKADLDARIAALSDPNSDFRLQIAETIAAKREELVTYLNDRSVDVMDTFSSIISSRRAQEADGGEWTGRRINDIIADLGSELTMRIEEMCKQISAMPEFEGALQFNVKTFQSKFNLRNVNQLPMHKRLMSSWSGVAIGMFGKAMLATVPVVGPFLAVGAIATGAFVSVSNMRDTESKHIEGELRQLYQQQVANSISNLRNYIELRFQDFQREWLRAATDRANAHRHSIQESLTQIQQIKQQIARSVNARVAVEAKMKPLQNVRESIDAIEL